MVRTMKTLAMEPDNATAVVELTVEVSVGAWGRDCTLEQAVAQATQDATDRLAKALSDERSMRVLNATCVRVVCTAKRQA